MLHDRYISWIEQTFPKGGKESHIDEILHKCVTAFRGDERYNSDTRFLDIWIKFVCVDVVYITLFLIAAHLVSLKFLGNFFVSFEMLIE